MTRRSGRNGRDAIRVALDAVKRRALSNNGRITDALLLDAEEDARREIGGASDYVNLRLPKVTRYRLYQADLDAGMSAAEVARKHGVSQRTIETAGKTPTELFSGDHSQAADDNGDNMTPATNRR